MLSTFGNAFYKSVGELPSHGHSASTNITGQHDHYIAGAGATGSGPDFLFGISNGGKKYTSSNGNHSHSITVNNTGSGQAHQNMQPYVSVYIWKRVV